MNTPDAPQRRLAGLDGVRGLAARYVVVNHIFLRTFPAYPADHAPFWAAWFIYGRFAVVGFIVLSGFSLALSPARHGWRLDSLSRFAYRRARRILPAYWAALALRRGERDEEGRNTLADPLTVVFAWIFAAVFDTPFLPHRSWPQDAGQQHPRAEGAPG